MTATLSLTETQVLTALRAFLVDVLPVGVEVVRGQDNRVSEPVSPDFVVMTPGARVRLSTNIETFAPVYAYVAPFGTGGAVQFVGRHGPVVGMSINATSAKASATPTQVTMQLDFHGPSASDNSQVVQGLFRDPYACDFFTATGLPIQPLYCNDAMQTAFLNGEEQYEDRWTLDVVLQTVPVTATLQQFADRLRIGLVNVDAAYPGA